jgi:hypothetical protein
VAVLDLDIGLLLVRPFKGIVKVLRNYLNHLVLVNFLVFLLGFPLLLGFLLLLFLPGLLRLALAAVALDVKHVVAPLLLLLLLLLIWILLPFPQYLLVFLFGLLILHPE